MNQSWNQRSEEKAVARGRAEGIAWSVLALLQKRGLPITEEQRLLLGQCRDVVQLESWLLRAADVSSVEELLPQTPQAPEEDDELSVAEANVEAVYQTLESLLPQRVQGQTNALLEEKIQAAFALLAEQQQARATALERVYQRNQSPALEELKEALAEAKRLLKESEEAQIPHP